MNTIKVKILSSSFGFNKGDEVEATIHGKGFFIKNGQLGKFIPLSEAEVVGQSKPEFKTIICNTEKLKIKK